MVWSNFPFVRAPLFIWLIVAIIQHDIQIIVWVLIALGAATAIDAAFGD